MIDKIKAWRKRRIERAFYKAFPERENWVAPEKQIATMQIVRCKNPTILYAKNMVHREIVADYPEAYRLVKEDIAKKLSMSLIEEDMIEFEAEENYFPDTITIRGKIEVIPPDNKRGLAK